MNRSLRASSNQVLVIAIAFLAVFIIATEVSAQDMHFTQYNAAPTSINPGYAGVTGKARAVTLYRAQWASLPQAFTGFHFAYDRPTADYTGGFGLLISNEEAGAGSLRSSRVAFQYAYEFKLSPNTTIRPALQMGFVSRGINTEDLTFMDQLLRDNASTSFEQNLGTGKQYIDMASGVLLVNKDYWLGLSADHLNTPNHSINYSYTEKLDIRYSFHGGGRIPLSRGPKLLGKKDVVFAFNYTNQGLSDQLDIGGYYDLKILTLGMWYRGIPIQKAADGSMDVDAISFVIGYGNKLWNIGYSYDLTISNLGLVTSGGSHEISLKYVWSVLSKERPPMYQPCVDY